MPQTLARTMFFLVVLVACGASQAADFVPYPGATLDGAMSDKSTKVARDGSGGDEVSVFTTSDPFDRVAAFYAKGNIEYPAPWAQRAGKLPDGRDIRIKVFILDGKTDVTESKRWVQVQYPFIGDVEMTGGAPRYRDVRNQTVIVYTLLK